MRSSTRSGAPRLRTPSAHRCRHQLWVSGLLWRGPAWRLLRMAETAAIEICIAPAMLLELAEVLGYERLQPRLQTLGEDIDTLVAYALSISTPIDVGRGPMPLVPDDPDDDILLWCAVAAEAAFVVSADGHVLGLGSHEGIPIVSLGEFLSRFA